MRNAEGIASGSLIQHSAFILQHSFVPLRRVVDPRLLETGLVAGNRMLDIGRRDFSRI
jgi:hypothetical protein